jgi:splicing factor U2AF subunit
MEKTRSERSRRDSDHERRRTSRSSSREERRSSRRHDDYTHEEKDRNRSSKHHSSRHRRSRSPEEDIEPLHKWKRKLKFWDLPPPGYESMTARQLKAMGIFPHPSSVLQDGTFTVPGARPVPLDMTGGGSLSSNLTSMAGPALASNNPHLLRQARRLYVGNIPFGTSESQIGDFFNQAFLQSGALKTPGLPVVAVQVNHEKNFAFVEVRSAEEATLGMAFDGIMYEGQTLKMRRPKDYQPIPGVPSEPPSIHIPGIVPTSVADSPNKIFIGGLPSYVTEEQVKELLLSFGELRSFHLVKDIQTNTSKGYAFCEYSDTDLTDIVCTGLNNMPLGDKTLVVQRATVSSENSMAILADLGIIQSTNVGLEEPTCILQLLNMITKEELEEEEEYEEIYEDVMEECSKFGKVLELIIPRPKADLEVPGVGKILVKYEEVESAKKAQSSLSGRTFGGRTVITSYLTEEAYQQKNY